MDDGRSVPIPGFLFFVSVPEPFRTASDSGCISSDGSGPYPVFPAIRPTVVSFDAMH